MGLAAVKELEALDRLEARWVEQGYNVVRSPSQDQLPSFLRGFRPDAIAIGQSPSLVIEVVRKRSDAGDSQIHRLNGLFGNRPDWRLEVVYLSQDEDKLAQVGRSQIREAIKQARLVCGINPRPGLLWAWSTLEAITRELEPELAARQLMGLSMVDVLVSNGHISQIEGKNLRELARMRNMLAHGQVDSEPEAAEIGFLLDLLENLASLVSDLA
jgi:hypothetical protein